MHPDDGDVTAHQAFVLMEMVDECRKLVEDGRKLSRPETRQRLEELVVFLTAGLKRLQWR